MSASREALPGPGGVLPQRATVRTKGVVTIPKEVRRVVRLEVGDDVIVTVKDGEVVLTPATVVPRDQAWFWTEKWQAREAEAEADVEAGQVIRSTSDEDFLASFDGD